MEKFKLSQVCAALLFVCAVAGQAMAVPSLWNTGVDGGGNALPPGQPDPHYALVAAPAAPLTAITVGLGYGWMDAPTGSAWIGQNRGNTSSDVGMYAYELKFDLVASDLSGPDRSGLAILGKWATDDTGVILLNGYNTGITRTGESWLSLEAFEISNQSWFVVGENVLRFEVTNAPLTVPGVNPAGLLVSDLISVPISVVPVPGAVLLVSLGTCAVGFIRRRGIL